MIDDIYVGLQARQNAFFRNNVTPNFFAALVRCLRCGIHFGLAHRHDISRPHQAVATSGIEFDDLYATFDFFAHRFAKSVRPVANPGEAVHV